MIYEKPEPIAAVEDTRALNERVGADGSVLRALDETSARSAIAELRDRGVEAVTVSLLNSFANPGHEQAVARLGGARSATVAAGVDPLEVAAGVPRVRAHRDHGRERVRPPCSTRYLSNLRPRLAPRDEGTAAVAQGALSTAA